jgi:hypothetical protein
MSGTIVNNVARASGTIAATPGGLDWSTAVVTGSTVTVEAGRGYFINTTSNACTVTLPASPEVGDQIVLADYARTWATNAVTLDSNGNNFQGNDDTYTVDYSTVGQSLNIVYADSTKGWLPVSDDAVAFDHGEPPTQKAIVYGGQEGATRVSKSKLINSSGVMSSDVDAVGQARATFGGASYGGDKAVFAYGQVTGGEGDYTSIKNLVNNSGVVQADVTGVGSARLGSKACSYGNDKAIFGYGNNASGNLSITNLCNNSGVIASDTTGVGTVRLYLAAASYDGDKGIFAFGISGSTYYSLKNLVSNSGVVATDVTGVGTVRNQLAAAGYGGDKAIFGFGQTASAAVSMTNLVNNSGVVGSDVTGVGAVRSSLIGVNYGGDKAVFALGNTGSGLLTTRNLVSNVGVVSADADGAGTATSGSAAAGYSTSA